MRTRIVTCATMEGECIWYSEIIFFFPHLVSRKALKVFFYVGIYQLRGWEGSVRKPKRFTKSVLCSILGQMLNKHYLSNDLISHRVRYKHVI